MICTENVRDYMIEKQVEFKDIIASQVVLQIRVYFCVSKLEKIIYDLAKLPSSLEQSTNRSSWKVPKKNIK